MSFELMAKAVKVNCGSPATKLVLLLLADRTNGDTGRCTPSHKRLAGDANMSVSALKVHLKKLEELGFVKVVNRSQDGVSLPNKYLLDLEGVGQNLATNQEVEPGSKTSLVKVTKNALPAQEILDAYNTILGTTLPKAQVLTSARRAAINARYKDMLNTTDPNGKVRYSNQEEATRWFTSFFRKVLMNPHWIGQNERGWQANLDWLMNPTNFVKVLEWKAPAKAAA